MDLAQHLISKGVLKSAILIRAFEAIDRKDFVPQDFVSQAYRDEPLPIGYGQTISQPYTVAYMLELLSPERDQHILDIGFGSGWVTSLLAHVVGKEGSVTAFERIKPIYEFGIRNIEKYGFVSSGIVKPILGDARAPEGKFDRIIAGAASFNNVPAAWKNALHNGGKLVAPVGNSIFLFLKNDDGIIKSEEHPGFVFVPLLPGIAND